MTRNSMQQCIKLNIRKKPTAMANTIRIQNKNFTTKKEAEDFTRTILYKYEYGKALQGDDLLFVLELLERHPDKQYKIGAGVKEIVVRPDDKYGQTRHFTVIRSDNTSIDFSFKKCFAENPNDPMKLFKAAARRAVEKQIIYFFNTWFAVHKNSEGKVECAISGEWVGKENAAVDHAPPDTFDKIVQGFITVRNIDVSRVAFTSGDNYRIGKAFADDVLIDDFANYHKQVAKLRITTKTANLKQKKI